MVVIREVGTKMPADLGGIIYLTIDSREDGRSTAKEIAESLRSQMKEDAWAP
jgi:CRISPR/Cas system-associated exonuclease Cas4 (RecB family)